MRYALIALLLSGCVTQESFGTCDTVRLGAVTGEPGFADECQILAQSSRERFRYMNPETYRRP